jgi:hypothetical protein
MDTSVALRRVRFLETPRLLTAVLLGFAIGGASGFLVRSVSLPVATSNQRVVVLRITEPCPSVSRAVVWYTAHAWGCVPDGHGG